MSVICRTLWASCLRALWPPLTNCDVRELLTTLQGKVSLRAVHWRRVEGKRGFQSHPRTRAVEIGLKLHASLLRAPRG